MSDSAWGLNCTVREPHTALSVVRSVRLSFPPGESPKLPQRSPGRSPHTFIDCYVTELELRYTWNPYGDDWMPAFGRVSGVAVLASGELSTSTRDLQQYKCLRGIWPAWMDEALELHVPRSLVSLLERPIVDDPATVVVPPGSPLLGKVIV